MPAVLAAGLGWLIFRLVQYPPFVDFLIATEAEMNKVSWTSRAELNRATAVVLVDCAADGRLPVRGRLGLVDTCCKLIGVLKFGGVAASAPQAG